MENLYVSEKCDLKAKWIWSSANTKGKNLYSFFRKKLSLSGECKMYISCDTRYELYIDGKLYDRGGAISPKDYKAVDMHCINFDSGEHVVGVIVHHIGCVCAATKLMQAGLIAEIRGSNGELLITDSSWKSVASDAFYHEYPLMSHFGFPVVCDYNKIPSDWASVDFDDSSWNSAVEISNANENIYGTLVEKDIPNLSCVNIKYKSILSFGTYVEGNDVETNAHVMASRKREVLKNSPKLDECFNTENTFIVVDMGREVSGHVALEIENAKSGQIIDIGYDELCTSGIPNPKRTYVNFADRVILRDAQKEVHIFEARGFRYLLIDINFMPEGFKIVDVSVDERVYPVNKSGYFKSSKSIYETLYNNSLQAIKLCMLDTYVDCPSRERVLWMDSYIEALFAAHCTDDTLLWKRVLFLYAQDCVKEGDLKGFVKGYCLNDYNNVIIMYVLYYVSSVIDYVYLSGDIDSGKKLTETIKNQFSGLENFKNELGFIDSDLWESWDFVDWCAMDLDGVSATINALYIYTLKRACKYFNFMGDSSYSLELKAISEDLSEKFADYFSIDNSPLVCDAVRGGVKSKAVSQLSNSMAVMANIFDKERNIKIFRYSRRSIRL